MTLRKLHAVSAILVAAFLALHMTNHLAGLAGVATHIAFMEMARSFYRMYLVEFALLCAIGQQVASGLTLVIRGWKDRRGLISWLQALSGLYLFLFLLIHVGAIMYGRGFLGLDTNFLYAAAGFHVPPWQWFFAPYYFLAVASLFTHVGCAVYWKFGALRPIARRNTLIAFVAFGVAAGLMIDLSLAGKLYTVDIPAAHRAVYRSGTN
jgi:hypothetical protein